MSGSAQIIVGDCVEEMAKMPADSVDSIVTDPPYGLEFMGKEWDRLWAKRNPADHKRPENKSQTASPYISASVDRYVGGHTAQAWHERWAREALRVLKPGGHLLAFGGTRTYHRMVCAIEDAGFEIRDSLHWIYGSGFPKSLDVSKAIDKMAGAERDPLTKEKVIPANLFEEERREPVVQSRTRPVGVGSTYWSTVETRQVECVTTAPATEAAQQWQGFGTSLKPAHEPICVARKPLSEKNVAQNVLKHGTGAINVDATRVGNGHGYTQEQWTQKGASRPTGTTYGEHKGSDTPLPSGRWPPNLLMTHSPDCKPTGEVRRVKPHNGSGIARQTKGGGNQFGVGNSNKKPPAPDASHLDPDGTEPQEVWECHESCPIRLLDEQSGQSKSPHATRRKETGTDFGRINDDGWNPSGCDINGYADKGGASRFFPRFEGEAPFRYVAKSSRRERNAGLEGMPEKPREMMAAMGQGPTPQQTPHRNEPQSNLHPTVKPIALMRWLVRLVTPPGGTVLDPFMGSGSTGCAAVQEGVNFIGIEMDAEYAEIARRRIAHWSLPERERSSAKTPPKRNGHLFANGTVRRCPEHDTSIPSGSNTYKCGCAIDDGTPRPESSERLEKPETPLETLF